MPDSGQPAPTPTDTRAVLDLSRLPQWAILALALGGGGAGIGALGLQQTDPPASRGEVVALEQQIRTLERAVDRLTYVVETHHGTRTTP